MYQFHIVNGPNLNLLGKREPQIYGSITLQQIVADLATCHPKINFHHSQSNAEHVLIDNIHQRADDDFIIINPAAFTHTSVALRDALLAVGTPFIEVHISNIFRREKFRQHSYFSDIAIGSIIGLGSCAYNLAVTAAVEHLRNEETN